MGGVAADLLLALDTRDVRRVHANSEQHDQGTVRPDGVDLDHLGGLLLGDVFTPRARHARWGRRRHRDLRGVRVFLDHRGRGRVYDVRQRLDVVVATEEESKGKQHRDQIGHGPSMKENGLK